MVEVTAPHISDLELGKRRPSPDLLDRIAKALQIKLEELEDLDTRVRPELKQWMDERPAVGQLLRRLKEARDSDQLLRKLRNIVEKETKGRP